EQRTLTAALKFYCNEELVDAHSAMADTQATHDVLMAQLERYDELEADVDALNVFTTRKKSADFAGFIVFNKEGEECFSFGKHKGKTVEREPRFIRISELKLTQWDSPKGGFFMSCSKGTYVRTVLHDLGQNLNCGAHMSSLRRTQIDQFSIDQAKPLQEIQDMTLGDIQNRLIPIREAVPSHVL
ncbi:MAG: hypothetical protein EBS74_07595, partial [Flavobacteriia bacterium]|nr:hypothetical protein [Flavobacteriia bacterium]